MRRAPALFLLAVVCLPAQDLPPGVLALSHIRARVRQTVDRLPDCTCVETVDRFRKPGTAWFCRFCSAAIRSCLQPPGTRAGKPIRWPSWPVA